MEPNNGLWALAIAVAIHAVAWFFRTPKETAGEMTARLETIETKHHALDVRFAIAEARLTAEMRHLADTIERLIELMEGDDSHARISGRHPTSRG